MPERDYIGEVLDGGSIFDRSEEEMRQEALDTQRNLEEEGEFGRGVRRGYHGLVGTFHGLRALGSQAIGDYAGRNEALRDYVGREREAAKHPKAIEKFFDTGERGAFGSPGNLATWVEGTAGELIPSVGEAVLSGLVGATAGGMLVPGPDPSDVAAVPGGFVAGLLSKKAGKQAVNLMAKKILRESAEDVTEAMAMAQAKKQLKTKAGQALVNELLPAVAQQVGGAAGVWATTASQETGGMFGDLGKRGIYAPMTSAALGSLSGLSEVFLGNVPGMGRLLFSKAAKKAVGDAVKKGGIKAGAKAMFGAIAEEGGQEAVQEFLAVLNEEINDPKFKITDAESFSRVMEAGAAGALGGMAFGGLKTFSAMRGDAPTDLTGKANPGQEMIPHKQATEARAEAMRGRAMSLSSALELINQIDEDHGAELTRAHQNATNAGARQIIERRILEYAQQLAGEVNAATEAGTAQRTALQPTSPVPPPFQVQWHRKWKKVATSIS
jgi:hypothetical protein